MLQNIADSKNAIKFSKLIFDFFTEVSMDRKIRHYFFNISFEKLLFDQINLNVFLLKREIKGVNTFPIQSSSLDVRVSSIVFDMVLLTLQNLLVKYKYSSSENNRFIDQIISIAEETRSQANDLSPMTLSRLNLTSEIIRKLVEKNKAIARVIDTSNILVVEGFETPINIQLLKDVNVIRLQSYAELIDSINLQEMLRLKTLAEIGNPFCIFEVILIDKIYLLYSHFEFSLVQNLPIRLFLSGVKNFSHSSNAIFEIDASSKNIMQARK
jgi:hypothetical protein